MPVKKVLLPVGAAAAGVMLVVAMAIAQPGSTAAGGYKLSKEDRAKLALAAVNHQGNVTLLIGTKEGKAKAVVDGLTSLGATVRYRDDDLGYVRVSVAAGQTDRVAAIDGVQAVEVDSFIPLPDPAPDGAQPAIPQPAPGAGTPASNPYMPTQDTGAAQFVAAHPNFDGRGVTVGVVDTGIDLVHPALTTTTTGEAKIVDWVTATHPTDDGDPTWVSMSANVSGPSFTVGGVTYTAPGNGSYRFGQFNERDPNFGGELGNDVNRDNNPPGSSGLFGVLWDGNDKVWVDVNQNGSFADEPAMREYKTAHDVRKFGTDIPATAVIEEIPFVIQIDGKNKFVNIGVVAGQHGTHVAGIIAANGLFGGAMDGAAPGAKLVSVRACLFVAGCTAHALVEGMIFTVKQANVDVINMSIGGLPSLNDGNNTRAMLYSRLIEKYNVQMFISAGNSGPGVNTVGDPSVADKVVSVGTYISDATWLSNYGSVSPNVDNMHYFSSRGPREDGGFKPSVTAPGAAISSTPQWQPGGPVGGTYALPPGYSMLNGTSMAAPQAAGAGALLVSAAKQEGFQRQPAQLRQAMMSTARYISGLGSYEQGTGLIQVGAAYDQLKTNIKTVDITASVPVNTLLSGFLATPGIGVGIHDREGVVLGQAYTRTYTFTRTSGGGGNITYNLSWQDNDGTFDLGGVSTLTLGLNTPATLTVNVNPNAAGIHSANLRLDDPATAGYDLLTQNTVVVPYTFTAASDYKVTISGSVGRNQSLHYFFKIPANTPAFKVDFSGPSATPGTGQARFLRFHPYGVGIDSNASTSCFSPSAGSCVGSPLSRTTANPIAGVWEVTVDARRTSDALNTPFSLTASILGATVAPNPDVIASASAGVPIARSYTLTNVLGPFTGRAVGTSLGSAKTGTFSIGHLAQQQYPLTVTPGSTSLRAAIGTTSDPGADLDLYVFNCTSGSCVQAGSSAGGSSEEAVTIANPAAGAWMVLVDAFSVPAGTTSYKYLDVFGNPAFGSVSVTDANALRASGAAWVVPGVVTANAAPGAGRVLLGTVDVRTDANVLVGSGDVIIQSVS